MGGEGGRGGREGGEGREGEGDDLNITVQYDFLISSIHTRKTIVIHRSRDCTMIWTIRTWHLVHGNSSFIGRLYCVMF